MSVMAAEMGRAGAALAGSLAAEDQSAVFHSFDDEERFDLRLAPFFLDGVAVEDFGPPTRENLEALLRASLGPVGARRVEEIRALEDEILARQREAGWLRDTFARLAGVWGRDVYYLTLYGEPSSPAPWGYRFDGHHVSLNFTVVGERVSGTPLFLGAEPRENAAGVQVLGRQEDLARALYLSLDSSLRARATLPFGGDRGLFVGEGERIETSGEPVGIARAELGSAQQALFDDLLESYFENVAAPIAARERARVAEAGRDRVHFAWAGDAEPGRPMYYRLQGPTLLIEFDNTEEDADHIHTLWRDGEGDFGRDLLSRHHAQHHGRTPREEN
jgi:hypothetical protein